MLSCSPLPPEFTPLQSSTHGTHLLWNLTPASPHHDPLPTTLPFHTPPVSDHCQSSHQPDCINVCCPLLALAQHNTVLLPAPFLSKNTLPKRSPEWHLHAGAWTTRALSPKQSSPCYRKVLPALRWTRKSLLWNLTLLPISVSIQSGLTTWKGLIFALAGRTASSVVSSTQYNLHCSFHFNPVLIAKAQL